MTVLVMLDRTQRITKPSSWETTEIQGYTSKKTKVVHPSLLVPVSIGIEDLAVGLSNGMTCRPAILAEGKRTAAAWKQQQIFMLDFDGGTTLEEMYDHANSIGIIPAFSYTSFSHSEHKHKFRFVFACDKIIESATLRDKIQLSLMKAFDGKADEKCYNRDRIFFGGNGKKPSCQHFSSTFNSEKLIESFWSEEMKIQCPRTFESAKKKSSTIQNPPGTILRHRKIVEMITGLNVQGLRDLLASSGPSSSPPICNYYFTSVKKQNCANNGDQEDNAPDDQWCQGNGAERILYSEYEIYNFINSISLAGFLGVQQGKLFRCILPDHHDRTPSASIYITDDGTPVYKCFGCGSVRTIIGIVENLSGCRRSAAIEFIKKVYGVRLEQSDWVRQQQQILQTNARYLRSKEFGLHFPNIDKFISPYRSYILDMLSFFYDYVSDKMKTDDSPLFFSSYSNFETVLNTRARKEIVKTITIFSLLELLIKVEAERIPEELLLPAKKIASKYGHKKLTNFYQVPEYDFQSLKRSEEIAKVLVENNMSMSAVSRDYILRTFGTEITNRIFPQFKKENARGTKEKANKETLRLSETILSMISENGFAYEKDISSSSQWKKSMNEIFQSYGLCRKRLNSELKLQFSIDLPGKSCPFIIFREETKVPSKEKIG